MTAAQESSFLTREHKVWAGGVEATLRTFLAEQRRHARGQGLPTEAVDDLAAVVLGGGKRLRPVLCFLGWRASGREAAPESLVRTAASLEMFHAFALVHDDVMDDGALRRGKPTLHRVLAARYAHRSDGVRLGRHLAILVGDLALVWADELLNSAALTTAQRTAVCDVVDQMRTKVMAGQYLDLLASGRGGRDVAHALAIARGKTAAYTLEGPLLAGAALAGADGGVRAALTEVAAPLGEAFQLRDDILGVLGDPGATGKPVLDDLREGKHTALMAVTRRNADAEQTRVLDRVVGAGTVNDTDAAAVRRVVAETGATAAIERMIHDRYRLALNALEDECLPPHVRAGLRRVARTVVERAA